jgi:alkylated DNA repair dioxygenase AlkB
MSAQGREISDAGRLPGFKLAYDVITPEEEARLIELVESCNPQTYPGDEHGGLRAISFGWQYDLGSAAFSPCDPAPEGLSFARDIAARFAGLAPEDFVQCLLNRYEQGTEIPWHCDKPIWQDIVGVSLGSPTIMQFRKPVDGGYRYGNAKLPPRSMYLLTGEIRALFDHSIPPVEATRWSITFRTFSDAGRDLRTAVTAAV